jgi:hypothetical protein
LLIELNGVTSFGFQEAIPLGVLCLEPVGALCTVRSSAIGERRAVRVKNLVVVWH